MHNLIQQTILNVAMIMAVGSASSILMAQDFNRDIRPILSDRCFKCHGPHQAANESGLRLDIESVAHEWQAFVPGDIDSSVAIERVLSADEDLKMPPPGSRLTISGKEIELLKKWVQQGAKYEQHWSFQALPKSVQVPGLANDAKWIGNPIDAFVLRELQKHQMQPSAESERWRWLRRVTFDLTGLPPLPNDIQDFINDESADAFEKVVDRLLASADFGQHMAVSWLDAARYADSYGYQADLLSPTWPWRDWVVQAFNENLAYDKFLSWQLAGDLIPDASRDQILATAFNRLHRQTNEGGSVELEWRTEYAADRVHTFGTAMLGMTLECARCHDHKFDPVPQQDYYNLFAFFNNVDEWGMYHDSSRVPTPSLLLPTEQQEKQIADIQQRMAKQIKVDEIARSDLFVDNRFDSWLHDHTEIEIDLKPVAHWSLDELDEDRQFSNSVENALPGNTSSANELVPGLFGNALKLSGDDPAEFPVSGNWLEPWQRFSISMWLSIPEDLKDAVILHRQGGTDVGTFGTRVSLENGRIRFAMTRFWPGNALAVESFQIDTFRKWHHVVISNNGSGSASGMQVYVDGIGASAIIRDRLTKDPQHRPGKNPGFVVGEQFRQVGFRGGLIDDISVFDKALSPVEVIALFDQKTRVSANIFDRASLESHYVNSHLTVGPVNKLLQEFLQTRVGVAETMVMREMKPQRAAWVLHRGDYDAPRGKENLAIRKTPTALPAFSNGMPENRLGLAQWLTADVHPLTARVAVNRFWQGFFGRGLVKTPNDFGYQSEMPLHSDLLDWLARDFVTHYWNVKRLCKQIVLSSTYRQTSRCDASLRKQDPENRLLARGPAQRLTAEMIRDMALHTSGLLNRKIGGPPVSPYQPVQIWRENNTMTPAYNQSVGKDLYRRSLYTVWKRTTPMPNMMLFDATSREVCTLERSKTNTPQQAMVLMNDVQFVEASRVLAENAISENQKAGDAAMIQGLFLRLTGRPADDSEQTITMALLSEQRRLFQDDLENATILANTGESATGPIADIANLAAVTVLAQAIMNSDATIWKR